MRELDVDLVRKMQASQQAFNRLYSQYGTEVSWAKHPPSVLTDQFIATVRGKSQFPFVYDLGCGGGDKALYMVRQDIRICGIDTAAAAIQMATQQAHNLGLSDRVRFKCRDLLELKAEELEKPDGVHEYQCINHIACELHRRIVNLIADILPKGGVFLTNAFCRDTTNFYGEDFSKRDNGEFVFHYDPNNPHHRGRQSVDGMYCYFFSEGDILALYSPHFRIEEMIKVPHSFIEGRFHWEALMIKR